MPLRLPTLPSAAALLALLVPLPATQAQAPASVPAWFADEVAWRVTGDSVRWEADNRTWRSADEPFEAYGLRFWPTLGGRGMRGVLFGIRDGKETRPFSEFRLFWHPGRQQVVVLQWDGWGGYAEGTLRGPVDGVTRLEQANWSASGQETRSAHDSRREGATQVDQQLAWVDGAWSPGRSYTWSRRPVPVPAAP